MSRRRWSYYSDWERFPTSKPREVKGGIKAQTTAGAFGKSWWAKRWIGVLESFNIGGRLQRAGPTPAAARCWIDVGGQGQCQGAGIAAEAVQGGHRGHHDPGQGME